MTGIGNIRDVIPFPRTLQSAEFEFETQASINSVYPNQVRLDGLIKTLKPALAGFACIASYFLKRLIKIKDFESPVVKLELAQ